MVHISFLAVVTSKSHIPYRSTFHYDKFMRFTVILTMFLTASYNSIFVSSHYLTIFELLPHPFEEITFRFYASGLENDVGSRGEPWED